MTFRVCFGFVALTLGSVTVAIADAGVTARPTTIRGTFGGRSNITIPVGMPALSDSITDGVVIDTPDVRGWPGRLAVRLAHAGGLARFSVARWVALTPTSSSSGRTLEGTLLTPSTPQPSRIIESERVCGATIRV